MSHNQDEKIKADQIIKTASQWFARLRSPEASEHDKIEFSHWLSADKSHEEAFTSISDVWNETGKLLAQPEKNTEEKKLAKTPFLTSVLWRFFNMDLPCFLRWGTGFSVAALIILMVFFQAPLHEIWTKFQGQEIMYITQNAEHKALELSDGSFIEMNADTRLTAHICQRERKIVLEKGEVFFQVARNPEVPFRIHTKSGIITVLGTKFNVKHSGNQIAVDVDQGRVQVKTLPGMGSGHTSMAIVITKGQGVDYTSSGNLKKIRQSRMNHVQSWRSNKIFFEETSLEEVAKIIRQQCNMTVFFPPIMQRTETFTGTFNRNQPMEILDAIKIAFDLDVKVHPTYAQFTIPQRK